MFDWFISPTTVAQFSLGKVRESCAYQVVRTQWYGDKRDVVKWATLVHLCNENKLKRIIQVAFRNDAGFDHKLRIDKRHDNFPDSVWNHFRDLTYIKRLGKQTCLDIQVITDPFHHRHRDAYIEGVYRTLDRFAGSPKVLFLDPDTGIAPKKAGAQHITVKEIENLWGRLKNGDWLVLYQHASRAKDWRKVQKLRFAEACRGALIRTYDCENMANDVVFFCAGK